MKEVKLKGCTVWDSNSVPFRRRQNSRDTKTRPAVARSREEMTGQSADSVRAVDTGRYMCPNPQTVDFGQL